MPIQFMTPIDTPNFSKKYPDLMTLLGDFSSLHEGDDVDVGLVFTKQYSKVAPQLFSNILEQLRRAEIDPEFPFEELKSYLYFADLQDAHAWLKKIRLILEAAQEKIQD